MACLRAKARARAGSRAATAMICTSRTECAGPVSAMGTMAAAPSMPIRMGFCTAEVFMISITFQSLCSNLGKMLGTEASIHPSYAFCSAAGCPKLGRVLDHTPYLLQRSLFEFHHHEFFVRMVFIIQLVVTRAQEPEARIITRVAQHHDGIAAVTPAIEQSFADEPGTDAHFLEFRQNADRRQPGGYEILGSIGNRDRGKQNVPDELPIIDRHKRKDDLIGPTEHLDQPGFVGAAKSGFVHLPDRRGIFRSLTADLDHSGLPFETTNFRSFCAP